MPHVRHPPPSASAPLGIPPPLGIRPRGVRVGIRPLGMRVGSSSALSCRRRVRPSDRNVRDAARTSVGASAPCSSAGRGHPVRVGASAPRLAGRPVQLAAKASDQLLASRAAEEADDERDGDRKEAEKTAHGTLSDGGREQMAGLREHKPGLLAASIDSFIGRENRSIHDSMASSTGDTRRATRSCRQYFRPAGRPEAGSRRSPSFRAA